jgi:ferritin-like metal-binding protein YciE
MAIIGTRRKTRSLRATQPRSRRAIQSRSRRSAPARSRRAVSQRAHLNTSRPIKQNGLFKFFMNEIEDLLSSEKQIIKKLPLMVRAASTTQLRQALQNHFKETVNQTKRLLQIFHILGIKAKAKYCQGMHGILQEGEASLRHHTKSVAKDAAIIAAAQKVEHYEIASYGTARAHAKILNLDEIADLLAKTLNEEAAADKKLSKIADGSLFTTGVNELAAESR